jgi:hypothetical protein
MNQHPEANRPVNFGLTWMPAHRLEPPSDTDILVAIQADVGKMEGCDVIFTSYYVCRYIDKEWKTFNQDQAIWEPFDMPGGPSWWASLKGIEPPYSEGSE